MPTYKLQVQMFADDLFPKDAMVNVLHYFTLAQSDELVEGWCEAVLAAYQTQYFSGAAAREMRCTGYVVGPPPQFPVGEAIVNEGAAPVSLNPREVALCLSYYAGRNLPRQRGRIYLPAAQISGQLGLRPTTVQRDKALDLGQALGAVGGVDVSWSVWSTVDQRSLPITTIWCDDEWDTVRRRGLGATTRETRVIPQMGSPSVSGRLRQVIGLLERLASEAAAESDNSTQDASEAARVTLIRALADRESRLARSRPV